MSSILTNASAMTALNSLRNVNRSLDETQTRISTGLAIRSGKENSAYFSISNTMAGDSGMYKSINEGLTLTKNSIATARLGAEQVVDLAKDFSERLAFAQGETVEWDEVKKELEELKARVDTTIDQSTFNGDSLVKGTDLRTVVTGVSRTDGNFSVTTISFEEQDIQTTVSNEMQYAIDWLDHQLNPIAGDYETTGSGGTPLTTSSGITLPTYTLDETGAAGTTHATASDAKQYALKISEFALQNAIDASTNLGIAEKSVELQKDFLSNLTDQIDEGVGAMVDANMEEEAAKLQALQVQQQLSTQALSIANQAPQQLMSLFQ